MSKSSSRRNSVLAIASRGTAYTAAAGASLVAGASDADGAIHYYYGNLAVPQGTAQPLDINFENDDFDDIVLMNYVLPGGNYQGLFVPYAPGKFVGFGASGLQYVSALSAGAIINSAAMGSAVEGSMAYGGQNPNAQFNAASDAYIGFAFPIGQTNLYNAWVRVAVDNAAGTLLVKDWAYQDQAGVGITAGDTGTLPILGDFNGDRRVDGGDFLAWQRGIPANYTVFDLRYWEKNFGGGLPAQAAVGSVPEPGTLGLLAAGALGVAAMRRRQTAS